MPLKADVMIADRCFDHLPMPSLTPGSAHVVQEGPTSMTYAHVIRPRNLMWLPAALLVAWGVLAAAGYGIAPSFGASTGSGTVTATVALDVHVGGTCAAGYSNAYGAMADNVEANLGTCGMTFGTNNGATSTLRVESARTTAGNVMFCRAATNTGACGTGGFTNVAGGTLAASGVGVDRFGVLATANTCTTQTWITNQYWPVPDSTTAGAGTTVCSMTGTTDGDYTFSFRAHPDTVTAGSYTGQALFTAEVT